MRIVIKQQTRLIAIKLKVGDNSVNTTGFQLLQPVIISCILLQKRMLKGLRALYEFKMIFLPKISNYIQKSHLTKQETLFKFIVLWVPNGRLITFGDAEK